MENNNDNIVNVESNGFKHNLVKIAVATVASVLAKKLAEEIVDRMHERRHTVTIETATT